MYLGINDLTLIDFSKPVAILDPGHGISTLGKRGNGILEYKFNRDIANRMKESLKDSCNVFITIPEDNQPYSDVKKSGRSLNLRYRCDIENKIHDYVKGRTKVVFISIHANAGVPSGYGWEIFTHNNASSESDRLAKCIMTENEKIIPRNRGMKKANHCVTRRTHSPAVLIEHGFMTNVSDATLLKSDDYKDKLTQANCMGICNYLGIPYSSKKDYRPLPNDIYELVRGTVLYDNHTKQSSVVCVLEKGTKAIVDGVFSGTDGLYYKVAGTGKWILNNGMKKLPTDIVTFGVPTHVYNNPNGIIVGKIEAGEKTSIIRDTNADGWVRISQGWIYERKWK